MKKVLFFAVLAVMTLSFASCSGDQTLRDKIVANQNYEGEDDEGSAWVVTFTEATFTATCDAVAMSITSSNWSVTENADGSGVITISDASVVLGSETFEGVMTGTVTKDAKNITLISGQISITLTPKK